MYISSNKNQANHFSKHYMLSDQLCLLSVTFLSLLLTNVDTYSPQVSSHVVMKLADLKLLVLIATVAFLSKLGLSV